MSRRPTNYVSYNTLGNDMSSKADDQKLEITESEDFDNFITLSFQTVCVLYVHAKWCQPCKQIAPRYLKMADHYATEKVFLRKLNGEDDICAEKGIRRFITAFPTFLIFKNGNVVKTIVGGDLEGVENVIQSLKN